MRSIKRAGIAATVAVALMAALAAPARADGESEARLHFELGKRLYQDFKLDEALQHFIAAYKLVPKNKLTIYSIFQTYSVKLDQELKHGRKNAPESRNALDAWNWLQTYLASETVTPEERAEAAGKQEALRARVAVVDVASDPPGAEIFLDGDSMGSRGRAPLALAVVPGNHSLSLALPGYRPGEAQVTSSLGASVPARVSLARLEGEVRVDSSPPGARVSLEPSGADLGVTPLVAKLPQGAARLRASFKGFVDQSRDVAVTDGAAIEVSFKLQRAAEAVATLSVRGEPQGAVVRLAGRDLGRVPLSIGELTPGQETLEIEAPGRAPWRGPVLLEAGAATRVEAHLAVARKPPWRGWKWVGFGGGAACLIAGGVVALLAHQARDDFYAQPTSAGRDRVNTLNLTADILMTTGVVALGTTFTIRALWSPPSSRADVSLQR